MLKETEGKSKRVSRFKSGRGQREAKFPSQTLSDFGRDKRFGWRFSV